MGREPEMEEARENGGVGGSVLPLASLISPTGNEVLVPFMLCF
jgi:hypothetical protein